MGLHLVHRCIVESLAMTRAFCKIFFFNSILFIFECDGGPVRGSDLAYSKNLEGNALRETYPDLWHIHYFSETLPMATRGDWSTGGMATGLQGTDNPVGLPNVCLICLLFSSRRISDQHKNGSCQLGFCLRQQWVLGAVFTRGQYKPPGIVVACVRPSVTNFVRAITHHPFKLGSPNLDHRCKRPWLRSLLFCGVIDIDLQGRI